MKLILDDERMTKDLETNKRQNTDSSLCDTSGISALLTIMRSAWLRYGVAEQFVMSSEHLMKA